MTASRPLELFTPSFSASGLSPEQISSKKDFFLGGGKEFIKCGTISVLFPYQNQMLRMLMCFHRHSEGGKLFINIWKHECSGAHNLVAVWLGKQLRSKCSQAPVSNGKE